MIHIYSLTRIPIKTKTHHARFSSRLPILQFCIRPIPSLDTNGPLVAPPNPRILPPLRFGCFVRVTFNPPPLLHEHRLHQSQTLLARSLRPTQLANHPADTLGQLYGVGNVQPLEWDFVVVSPTGRVVYRHQRPVWRDANVGIIERLVLVAEDGEFRFCVDVRRMNVHCSSARLQDR